MLIRKPSDIPPSEITDERLYLSRRAFLGAAGGMGLVAASGGISSLLACTPRDEEESAGAIATPDDELTPYEDITSYNNFFEFGTDKADPAVNARGFVVRPWTIAVGGLVKKPGTYALEDFLQPHRMEDRVYRMRCVEAWSMVIPWRGVPLRDMIARFEPQPSAKYVEFLTLHDPKRMPGQRRPTLNWPYREGLRLDEAMHPLTLMVTGLYGKDLPNQNGAPLRLVVPWKYGFKGIKSIVSMRFVERQPLNTWQEANPDEYGFYANVNPTVDHPRWSQAKERRIGEFRRRDTLMFNGYAEQVASLYGGMDLRKNY